jgi:hypothetical protein
MVKYRRTGTNLMFTSQTTGGATVDIANTGVTVITSTAAERYVLAPPVAGAQKTLVFTCAAGTTGSRTVELSSASSGDTITLMHTTGSVTATEILWDSTNSGRVELLGLNTTQWMLMGSNLGVAATTGIVFQTS